MFGVFRKPHANESDLNQRMLHLNQLICKLNFKDPKMETFGSAHGHRFQMNPVLSLSELQSYEQEYAVKLPQDYADFLTHLGNGGIGPGYGLFSLQESHKFPSKAALSTPFPLTHAYSPYGLKEDDPEFIKDYNCGSIILSHHGCGIYSLLVISGPQAGQVWSDDACNTSGIQPMGKNFYQWYEEWLVDSIHKLDQL